MHILHETIGPANLRINAQDKFAATITMGPLPQSYGVTIGNSLRRTLISSLPGTAVVSFKIGSATHEFSTIEGIVESTFNIGLNLRVLKLAKHTSGVETVEVTLKKKGIVTAADLKVSSDIEILDPSQVICTCDALKADTKMFIRVEKNVGYRLIETKDNANNPEPEFILLDADFSPVEKVSYAIEPARFGDITNLDSLVLTVRTNGSISAHDALVFAANLLKSYFSLFSNEESFTDEEFITSFEQMKRKKESEQLAAAKATEVTFTPIDILGLSQRTLNALVNGGIASVEQLSQTPMPQLMQLRGFGTRAKEELEEVMQARPEIFAVSI